MATYTNTPVANPMEMAYVQSAVASMAMPTPTGLGTANASEYTTVIRKGRFGIMRRSAMPMATAAKIKIL